MAINLSHEHRCTPRAGYAAHTSHATTCGNQAQSGFPSVAYGCDLFVARVTQCGGARGPPAEKKASVKQGKLQRAVQPWARGRTLMLETGRQQWNLKYKKQVRWQQIKGSNAQNHATYYTIRIGTYPDKILGWQDRTETRDTNDIPSILSERPRKCDDG